MGRKGIDVVSITDRPVTGNIGKFCFFFSMCKHYLLFTLTQIRLIQRFDISSTVYIEDVIKNKHIYNMGRLIKKNKIKRNMIK